MVETQSPRFLWWLLREVPKQSRLWIPQDSPCLRKVISFIRYLLKQQSKGLTKLHPVWTKPLQARGEMDSCKVSENKLTVPAFSVLTFKTQQRFCVPCLWSILALFWRPSMQLAAGILGLPACMG